MSTSAKKIVDQFIRSAPVAVFSKTYCSYCSRAKQLLKSRVDSQYIQIMELDRDLSETQMSEAQKYLQQLTGERSVPRIFIDGKSIGGFAETQELDQNNQLTSLIEQAKKNFKSSM